MAGTFQDRLDAVTNRQEDGTADGTHVASIDFDNLQARSWRALTRVRATTDVSEWIFVGNAVRADLVVTRNADSAGEFDTGRIGMYGWYGVEKPAASNAGILITQTAAGENTFARLTAVHDYTRPMPMWLKIAVHTAGGAGDFADATVKLVTGQ